MEKSAMEKLLDSVLINIAKSNPSTPLTLDRKNKIENRFRQLISNLRTPSHPPYALMIRTAITELNEKRGSSEASISTFIKKEYDDLPWAHASYLTHYLEKLGEKGEIFVTRSKCYKVLNLDKMPKEGTTVRNQKRKRDKLGGETLIEEENQSREKELSGLNDVKEPTKQGIRLRFICERKGENEGTNDGSGPKWLRIEVLGIQERSSHDPNGQVVKEKNNEGMNVGDCRKFCRQDKDGMGMTEILQPCNEGMEHEQPEKVRDSNSQQETTGALYNEPLVSLSLNVKPDRRPPDIEPIAMEHSSPTQHKKRQSRILRQLEWSMDVRPTSIIEATCQSSEKLRKTCNKRKQLISSTLDQQPSLQQECSNKENSLAIVQNQEETVMESLLQPKEGDRGTKSGHVSKRTKCKRRRKYRKVSHLQNWIE